ncbi:MAG: AMP-binding protein [Myxococcota bacterium]
MKRADHADELSRVLDVVRSVVVDVSDGRGLGQLGPDVSFERELGLGSLERVELAVRAGKAFGVQLSEDAIATADTPRQLLAHLCSGPAAAVDATPQTRHRDPGELRPTEAPVAEPLEATTLVEVLEYHLREQPDRVHIVLQNEDDSLTPITYRELYQASMTVARALRQRGLEPGRCVAIMLPTGLGYFATFMGTLLAGGVPVPLYPPVRLDRITEYIERCAKILDNAQAQLLVTFDRAARVADIARDRVSAVEHVLSVETILTAAAQRDEAGTVRASVVPEHTALIQYTSGSTGDPKGVELTHANVVANIRAAVLGCELGPEDALVSWLPLYHDMGLIGGWLMPLYYGVPTLLMSPMAFLSKPERWVVALSEFGGTCSVAPNFAFDLCVKRIADEVIGQIDLAHVRTILNGSEPILPATLDRFVERFTPAGLRREALFCAYGLAENMVAVAFPPVLRAPRIDRIERAAFEGEGRAVSSSDADALEFVGVGKAVPAHEVQVVDDAGQPVPERRQGTVRFRGPSSFKGYFRRPDATAQVQCEGGWVDTGDLGYLADGELFITGRVKDLIIKGGRNYYPHEIEAAAGAVDGIRLGCVAAFAVRDESSGTEQIVVIAETRQTDGLAREILEAQVNETVTARVGVPPDRVVLAPPGSVPKTSSGKIRRRQSRELYESDTLTKDRGSFKRQAAGLLVGSLPTRMGQLGRRVGRAAYGGYALSMISGMCLAAPLVGRVVPAGRPSRRLAVLEARAALSMAGLNPVTIDAHHLPPGAAIIVANHAGYLDFLICTAALPADLHFVIKGEMRNNGFVGPVLRKQGHIFIDRHSTARSLHDLQEVTEKLEQGQQVMLFPEGTFLPEIGMRPFKLGAFRLASETGVPVVPVAIRGSRRALRDGTWLPRHERLEVQVLPPLHPEGREIADIVRLRDRCAELIAARIDEPRLFAADIRVPGGEGDTGG